MFGRVWTVRFFSLGVGSSCCAVFVFLYNFSGFNYIRFEDVGGSVWVFSRFDEGFFCFLIY